MPLRLRRDAQHTTLAGRRRHDAETGSAGYADDEGITFIAAAKTPRSTRDVLSVAQRAVISSTAWCSATVCRHL
jgi:hypothetical protein